MPLRIVAVQVTSYGATQGFPEFTDLDTEIDAQTALSTLRHMHSKAPSTRHDLQEFNEHGRWQTLVSMVAATGTA